MAKITADIPDVGALSKIFKDTLGFGLSIISNSADPMTILAPDKTVYYVNPAFERFTGFTFKEAVGVKPPYPWWPKDTLQKSFNIVRKGTSKGVTQIEHRFQTKKGKAIWVEITSRPVKQGNIAKYFVVSIADITRRRASEEALGEYRTQLNKQKREIKHKDIALREVMTQIEEGKTRMQREIAANVNNLIVPLLKKLRLKGVSQKYLDLIEANLREITSSFGSKINDYKFNLSRREIEICDSVKNGLTSKEIATLLNLSTQTVEKHRTNIRKKLSILNADVNLATFLSRI